MKKLIRAAHLPFPWRGNEKTLDIYNVFCFPDLSGGALTNSHSAATSQLNSRVFGSFQKKVSDASDVRQRNATVYE